MEPLRYDFSMFSVVPTEVFADPALRGLLHASGIREQMPGNRIALFRDPQTCAVLRAAPQVLRDYMLAAGFGEAQSPCSLPIGVYRASDEADRLRVMSAMTEKLHDFDLPKAGSAAARETAFNLGDMLRSLVTAAPVADDWLVTQVAAIPKRQVVDHRLHAPPPKQVSAQMHAVMVPVAIMLAGGFLFSKLSGLVASGLP